MAKPAEAVEAEAYEANDAEADEADEAIVVDKPAEADVANKPTSERGRQANMAVEADKAVFMTIVATDAISITEIEDATNLLDETAADAAEADEIDKVAEADEAIGANEFDYPTIRQS